MLRSGNPEVIQRSRGGLSDEVLENSVLSNLNSPGATPASHLKPRLFGLHSIVAENFPKPATIEIEIQKA